MFEARYYDADGTQSGTRDLPAWLFDGVVNESALHQAVKAYLANQRQGTASAKNRSAVAGGSRKPWRQKGTGRARQGSIRAVQWAGGGRAFPPQPKSWRQDIPRKVKALARRSALNSRAIDDRVVLVADLEYDTPKTRRLVGYLETIGVGEKVLLLTDGVKEAVHLSGRNVQEIRVMPFGQESAYDVLWAGVVVIESAALEGAEAPKSYTRKERREIDDVREGAAEKVVTKEKPARKRPAKKEAAAEAAPTPEKAERAAPAPEPEREEAAAVEAASVDVDAIELPKVADLAAFLAEIDDAATVRALQSRDARKTAQAHYDARLAELEGTDA